MAIEQAVAAISPRHSLGSLMLDAQPAKHSLRSEAATWKAQFSKTLHKQGLQNLKARAMCMSNPKNTLLSQHNLVCNQARLELGIWKPAPSFPMTRIISCIKGRLGIL